MAFTVCHPAFRSLRQWVCYHCWTSPGSFDNPCVSLLTPLCISERCFSVPALSRLLIRASGRHQTEQPCSLLLPQATGSLFSCIRSSNHTVVAWFSSLTRWKTKQRRRGRIYFPSCRQTELTHLVHLLDSARGRRWASRMGQGHLPASVLPWHGLSMAWNQSDKICMAKGGSKCQMLWEFPSVTILAISLYRMKVY